MHVGIHYTEIMDEYALPSNCNVLIGEDKHRWFKKIVYNTNFSNVERLLLTRESLQQTIRLILLDAFQNSEPELTATIKDLYSKCPMLFESLLPRSERLELSPEEDEPSQSILHDANHLKPATLSRLKPTYCRDELGLPIRSSAFSASFRRDIRQAYENDYKMPNIIHFGTGGISWCKKLSFTDKDSKQRLTFQRGDVIQFHDDKIGRLDHIFTHENLYERRLFCIVTKATLVEDKKDDVLDMPLLKISNNQLMISLPAILGRKLYMLPVSQDGSDSLRSGDADDMLLWVRWHIQYL